MKCCFVILQTLQLQRQSANPNKIDFLCKNRVKSNTSKKQMSPKHRKIRLDCNNLLIISE